MLFYLKIGHFTMDGASNNNTMLVHLQKLLIARKAPTRFDPVNNWVQCYVHTIDLACKAVVGQLPDDMVIQDCDEAESCRPVALASDVVRTIRGLSSC
jgi:hypothetical protein